MQQYVKALFQIENTRYSCCCPRTHRVVTVCGQKGALRLIDFHLIGSLLAMSVVEYPRVIGRVLWYIAVVAVGSRQVRGRTNSFGWLLVMVAV